MRATFAVYNLAQFLSQVHAALEIMAALGCKTPRDVKPEMIYRRSASYGVENYAELQKAPSTPVQSCLRTHAPPMMSINHETRHAPTHRHTDIKRTSDAHTHPRIYAIPVPRRRA